MSLQALALVSAGVGAVGSLVSGVSQAGQAKRQAQVAEANADQARQQGEEQANLIREKALRLRGANRAAAGASGVDISSFNDVFDDSDISAELDAQTAIRNAKQQANNFKAEAAAQKSSRFGSIFGGVVGAGTQALQGYGSWKLLKTMPSTTANGASGGAVNPYAFPAGAYP